MVLGTGYDLYLVHQSRHFFSENYTYEIRRASPPNLRERSMKLDVDSFAQNATLSPGDGVINHGKSLPRSVMSKRGHEIQGITSPAVRRKRKTRESLGHVATAFVSNIILAFPS
jgi:hypothetical protein